MYNYFLYMNIICHILVRSLKLNLSIDLLMCEKFRDLPECLCLDNQSFPHLYLFIWDRK